MRAHDPAFSLRSLGYKVPSLFDGTLVFLNSRNSFSFCTKRSKIQDASHAAEHVRPRLRFGIRSLHVLHGYCDVVPASR